MTRYLYLGGAIAALAAIIGAYFYGVGVGVDRQRSRDLAAMQKAEQAMRKASAAFAAIDQTHAAADVARETTIREIIREVPQIVDRPVYRSACVDADGLRLLERAVASANGNGAGGPDGGAGEVREPADRR